MDDAQLIEQYAHKGSQKAFKLLVERYQGLVYSAALRRVGCRDLAEDVTQAVFIILAKKAGTIRHGNVLSSWLYQTTRYAAIDALRKRKTQARHEREAAAMNPTSTQPEHDSTQAAWRDLGPYVEEAMDRLGRRDREAVLLRFFEHLTLQQIAQRQGVSTATAHRRVDRALASLQKHLKRRGVALSAGAIGSSLLAHAVHAAPAGVSASIPSMAIAASAGAAGTGGAITIAEGAMTAMKIAQMKVAAVVAVAGVSVAGTGVAVQKAVSADPPPPPAGYVLQWSDEFDGEALDASAWHTRGDAKGRSVQLAENVSIENGELVLRLTPLDAPVRGMDYAGAGVVSSQAFGFGYYEVRAKLGDGVDDDADGRVDEGWHHAFWSMRTTQVAQGQAVSTSAGPNGSRLEIDGFENSSEGLGRFRQHLFVQDEAGQSPNKLPAGSGDLVAIPGFDASEWHVYGFEWTPERVRFFVDGEFTHEVPYDASQQPVHDLNVWLSAISADGNDPDPEASEARYDYFRYYVPE